MIAFPCGIRGVSILQYLCLRSLIRFTGPIKGTRPLDVSHLLPTICDYDLAPNLESLRDPCALRLLLELISESCMGYKLKGAS